MGAWRNRTRPRNQIWGSGVQHRPDDISIVGSKGLTDTVDRSISDSGDVINPIDPGDFNAQNLARRVREFRQTLTANVRVDLTFDSVCVGLGIMVDATSPASSASVGAAFGGDIAAIPSNSNNLVATSEVKNGESRFYDVKTDKLSMITSSSGISVRATVLLP